MLAHPPKRKGQISCFFFAKGLAVWKDCRIFAVKFHNYGIDPRKHERKELMNKRPNLGMTQTTRQTQELAQKLTQTQIQTASANQVILSQIMEKSLAEFEDCIKNELESNEALEYDSERMGDDTPVAHADADSMPEHDSLSGGEQLSEYITIDQVPADKRDLYNRQLARGAAGAMADDHEPVIADTGATSYEDILAQIGELPLDEEERKVMEYLVGSLDENGFLAKDDETLADELMFQEYIDIDIDHLRQLIDHLQSFEPRGIGARNLRECLLLQMTCAPEEHRRLTLTARLAHKVVRDMWDELSHSRWERIQDVLDVDDATLADIQHTIRRLNPRPGSGLNESIHHTEPTVIPDFEVYVDDNGNPVVVQNRGDMKELRVSSSYAKTVNDHREAEERARREGRTLKLSRSQQEAYRYAVHKVESARAFIDNVERRFHTLQNVMECIVEWQRDFFVGDDDQALIRPMVLRDIAERAGVDISTVSRVRKSKYVKTMYGTYKLHDLFSAEFVNTDGESVSQRQARLLVKEIIESEDPRHPYSDQKITQILAERGTTIARRTVAKYRDSLGFAPSNLRRR